jgi:S1-C subfamily serine protease
VKESQGSTILSDIARLGPAYRSGLRNGDQLLSINGSPIKSVIEYARTMLTVSAGSAIQVRIQREGRERSMQPVPISNAAWTVVRRIGVEFEVLDGKTDPQLLKIATQQLYQELKRRVRRQLPAVLRVTHVHKGSPAHKLGMSPGDVLLGIVDQVPDLFSTRNIINTYADIRSLNDSLHVMANRRSQDYNIWILRKGEVLDGTIEIPRL